MKFENTKSIGYRNSREHVFYSVLLIGFLAMISFPLYAQDTDNQEFWFVAPDASISHADRPTFLMITTGDQPATVTISMPKNPNFRATFTDTVRTLAANDFWKFEFIGDSVDIVENSYQHSGEVMNKGILITSTAPVSAYYQIDGDNKQREIFMLKGKKALGTDFYMPFQTEYPISDRFAYNNEQYRQIQIVATEDGTEVTIHPKSPDAKFSVPAGDGTYECTPVPVVQGESPVNLCYHYINSNSDESLRTRTLNKGQTLLWREAVRNTPDLTGTKITSTKPVAVTLYEDCVEGGTPGGSADPIGDQMVPTGNLGQNYIVVKGYSSGTAEDHAVVLAVKEGTTEVWLGSQGQSETLVATLTQGKFHTIDLGNAAATPGAYYIRTTQPVYCMHQSATGTEVGGALLPSLYSISGRRITFVKGTLSTNAMFLVFRQSAEKGFTLDGESLTVSGTSVGFGDWMYAKVDLINNSGREEICTVANSEGSFALGYFNGTVTGTSLYGYLSAFGTFSFENDTIYACHSYIFDAPYAQKYDWTVPEGVTITNSSRLETTKSGLYILKVNQDPYEITDTTYLKVQNFRHILNAPDQLLENKSYHFSIELNPQKDKDNYFKAKYEWKFFDDENAGSTPIATSTDAVVPVSYSTPGNKNISLQIWNEDANCDTIITRTITVLDKSEGLVMYWKPGAQDRDWNNVNNWAKDPEGQNPIEVVPADYTKVYLPGNAVIYPSLTEENTDWTHYGQPETDEIVFRYGSELHYQHKLKYNKAYINYNWGYYGDNPVSGQQPLLSLEDARILSRDTWHILAAPLKSMASGDFSLAGHPFSWQTQFEVTTSGSVTEGDLSQAFPTNDVPLADNNNAIAVKMAGYNEETGYRQTHLEDLHGVIEIPYFGNNSLKAHYPAHNYDDLAKKSYFYYFDTRTLKLLNAPLGSMSRAGEAYRFVYETNQNEPPVSGIYEMPLNTESLGTTREVMVGNPFLAPIDAQAFADANMNAIDVDQGFKLLSEDGSTWEQHYFTEGDAIPAWKAFIVTLSETVASSLSFPLEATMSLRTTKVSTITRASYDTNLADNALSVHILKAGIESGDCAILQNNRVANNTEIRKMILPEGHEAPEIFFMSSGRDLSYLTRNLTQDEKEIPIGVKTSDVHSPLSLEFRNISAFTASVGANVILVDKYLNIRQDLTRNAVYRFTQQASGLDKQYVDKNRFVLQLSGETGTIEQEDPENGINIIYHSGILKITSDENISSVLVYDLYGRVVFSAHSVNLSQYTQPVALQGKLFLVRVKTNSGKVKVKKIMGN